MKIQSIHNSVAGHCEADTAMSGLTIVHKLWKYMRAHVCHFIQICPACQKMSVTKFLIHSKSFAVATYVPMIILNIDFTGSINTDYDNGYILVIVDCFTKWVATVKEAAACLLQHFDRYGAHSEILSDNGSHFVYELIKEFIFLARVERANKEVSRHVRHICFDRHLKYNWKQRLPITQRIINSHYSERKKSNPLKFFSGKL